VKLEPEAIDALLERWPVARLVTLAADGRPAPVPIVFARVGAELYSPIDGKPKRGTELERERNLRADPRVALLLDHYEDDWERLWWLRVEGRATLVPASEHPRALEALRAKYPQYARVPLSRGEPRLLRIAIERLSSWRASARAGI
jgi:PPOX class probable F420-dependent enzyme